MSQQEFMPEGQKVESEQQESYRPRQFWRQKSKTNKTGEIPKQEHPSAYEESGSPYGYQAQENRRNQTREGAQSWSEPNRTRERQRNQERQAPSWQGAGGTWQAPWWARPQPPSRSTKRWGKFLLIALIVLIALPILVRLLILLFTIFIVLALVLFLLLLFLAIGFLFFRAYIRPPRQRWWRW